MHSLRRILVAITSAALLMETIDGTIISTAIPAISASLDVTPIDLKISLISYFLSLAIFIPISGWISDKIGDRKVFLFSLGIFILSSAWCGAAHNLFELIVARLVQGLGGALLLPVGRLIVLRNHEQHQVISANNYIAMVGALGAIIGPVLGGFITHYFTWRWIFYINIPVGIITFILAYKYLPASSRKNAAPFDKTGFLLFSLGLACFTFGISTYSNQSISTSYTVLFIGTSFIALMLYFWHSRQVKHPIVNLDLFKFFTFRISMIGNLVARLGFGGVPFLLPILLQVCLGYSAQASGLMLAPWAFGILLAKPLTLTFLRGLGFKRLLLLNTCLLTCSIWSFSRINEQTPSIMIGCLTFIYGFLISMQYAGMNSLAYAEVPKTELSSATSMVSTLQQMGQSFGIAIAAITIHFIAFSFGSSKLLTSPMIHDTFFIMGIVVLCSLLTFSRLSCADGQQMLQIKRNM